MSRAERSPDMTLIGFILAALVLVAAADGIAAIFSRT